MLTFTMFFDGISEQHATCAGGAQRCEDRGSEHTGSAHTQGHCSPAWSLSLLLLKTGVCEHQPNLTPAYIGALKTKEKGRAMCEIYLETNADLEREKLKEALHNKKLTKHKRERKLSFLNSSDEIIHSTSCTQCLFTTVQQHSRGWLCFSGVSMWQSPTVCSELLSGFGQSLKVEPINGKERPGLTQIVMHSDMKAAADVRAEVFISLLAQMISKGWLRSPTTHSVCSAQLG